MRVLARGFSILAAGLLAIAAGCASTPAPNHTSLAQSRLSQAEQRCATASCEYAATILNVRAQVELDSGHAADAARLAQAAAERSRGAAGRAETANALRTLGRARLTQREAAAALEPLKQALE